MSTERELLKRCKQWLEKNYRCGDAELLESLDAYLAKPEPGLAELSQSDKSCLEAKIINTQRALIRAQEYIKELAAEHTALLVKHRDLEQKFAALQAMPVPDPVAFTSTCQLKNIEDIGSGEMWAYDKDYDEDARDLVGFNGEQIALYTSQPRQKPFSDEEVVKIMGDRYPRDTTLYYQGFRDSEKAHGIGG